MTCTTIALVFVTFLLVLVTFGMATAAFWQASLSSKSIRLLEETRHDQVYPYLLIECSAGPEPFDSNRYRVHFDITNKGRGPAFNLSVSKNDRFGETRIVKTDGGQVDKLETDGLCHFSVFIPNNALKDYEFLSVKLIIEYRSLFAALYRLEYYLKFSITNQRIDIAEKSQVVGLVEEGK